MNFDYCEIETPQNGVLTFMVGCRFEDEPDELYVIQLDASQDGSVRELKLFFNGHDCKYMFKPEESDSIIKYLGDGLPETEYADWFHGSFKL